jgi:hypothetical protein
MSGAPAPAKPPRKKELVSVNLTFTSQKLVHAACEQMDYGETESYTECLLFWYGNAKSAAIAVALSPWQFANHFGASFVVYNKVELARRFGEMRARLPWVYDFHPRNSIFPQQLCEFEDYLAHQPEPQTFIIKPDKGCAGAKDQIGPRIRGSVKLKGVRRLPEICFAFSFESAQV